MIFLNKNILNHKLLFDFFHLTLILFAGVIVCLSTLTFVPLLGTPVQLLIQACGHGQYNQACELGRKVIFSHTERSMVDDANVLETADLLKQMSFSSV